MKDPQICERCGGRRVTQQVREGGGPVYWYCFSPSCHDLNLAAIRYAEASAENSARLLANSLKARLRLNPLPLRL